MTNNYFTPIPADEPVAADARILNQRFSQLDSAMKNFQSGGLDAGRMRIETYDPALVAGDVFDLGNKTNALSPNSIFPYGEGSGLDVDLIHGYTPVELENEGHLSEDRSIFEDEFALPALWLPELWALSPNLLFSQLPGEPGHPGITRVVWSYPVATSINIHRFYRYAEPFTWGQVDEAWMVFRLPEGYPQNGTFWIGLFEGESSSPNGVYLILSPAAEGPSGGFARVNRRNSGGAVFEQFEWAWNADWHSLKIKNVSPGYFEISLDAMTFNLGPFEFDPEITLELNHFIVANQANSAMAIDLDYECVKIKTSIR